MPEACYILHRRAYRESSLLVDVFSFQRGRFTAIAKGAYKRNSERSALLQPFQPLLIECTSKGSLPVVTSAEAPSQPITLRGVSSFCGLYVNELILKLCPELQTFTGLFELYAETLAALSAKDQDTAVVRWFELRFLSELGLLTSFDADWRGDVIDADARYYLGEDMQFVSTLDNQSANVRLYDGANLQSLSTLLEGVQVTDHASAIDRLSPEMAKDARHLCAYFIDQALEGRALNSRDLLKQHKEFSAALSATGSMSE